MKNKFNQIYLSLQDFKNEADSIFTEFRRRDSDDRNLYSDVVYNSRRTDNQKEFKAKLDAARKRKREAFESTMSKIESDLKKWMTAPVDSDLISTLSFANSIGVKFSIDELQALSAAVGNSYLGNRILGRIAAENGLRYPDIDATNFTKLLERIRVETSLFLDGYCGESAECAELIDEKIAKFVRYSAAAPSVLKQTSPLLKADLLWRDADVPSLYNFKITDDEREVVKGFFAGLQNEDDLKVKAAEIIGENPELYEVIMQTDYRHYLPLSAPAKE